MNKKGDANTIWIVVVAVLALVVLITMIWIFREPALQMMVKLRQVMIGINNTDVNVTNIVKT